MRAPVTILIPTLNAAGDLPGALACLTEGLQAGLIRELVVSDGSSDDVTVAMAQAAGAIVVTGPAGRGGQLRRGAAAASGEWLLVLHADSYLCAGWAKAVLAHLATPERAGYFRLAFRARGLTPRIVAGWANLRARVLGLPYGDQGLLISRALYDRTGGYPDIPLMEDVAIARALRGHLAVLDATAATSAARYLERGWTRRGARNLFTLARYLAGADPAKLAKSYTKP